MAKKLTIVVVAGTGAQGDGLVRAICGDKDGPFRARVLTSDTLSDAARALARLGAEVIEGYWDDLERLKKAFAKAHGVYCVIPALEEMTLMTYFWRDTSPEKWFAQACVLAQAAKESGVAHAIWSTLEDTRQWVPLTDDRMPTLMGKYKVPHFDAKGEANRVFTENGVPTTFLLTSFYWDEFIYSYSSVRPKKDPGGDLAITLPMGDKKLPGIAADDIGACALGIFRKGPELVGKTVGIAGGHPTGAEMAASFTRALGREVRYNAVEPEVYRGFWRGFGFQGGLHIPSADDMRNMFQFKRDFNEYFCGARSVEFSRSLNPRLQDFDTWLARNKAQIPLE